MARTEVTAAKVLGEAAARWEAAYRTWQQAIACRDDVVARAERRIVDATGGLGLRRFEQARHRRRIYTTAEALMVARAVRARTAVDAAIAELHRARESADSVVMAARLELADATKHLLRYGSLAETLTGLEPAELRRLARRPPQGPARTRA